VAAQIAVELLILPRPGHTKEQMTFLWQTLHHGYDQHLAQVRRHAQFEELACGILANVQGNIGWIDPCTIALSPSRGDFTDFHARSHRSELGLNIYCIHIILLGQIQNSEHQFLSAFG
jgi:hypothetical protein